ncbi:MAG TPA: hypothetical protein VK215_00410 [Acidimicrobiales bacterium]|nr:hypothetical protein [Acidimicrobiales bacterium]
MRDDKADILGEALETVVTDVRPRRVAVTTGIDRERLPATLRDPRRGSIPRVARLAAAVQEDDRRISAIPSAVTHESEAIPAFEVKDRCARFHAGRVSPSQTNVRKPA